MPAPPQAQLDAIERWFIHRGLPHFIRDYSAGTDVWTRSLPVLALAYVVGGLNALDLASGSVARNVVALTVTLAILAAGLVLANLIRRRRLLAVPDHIGPGELALVVLGPAVPSLVLGQPGDAVQTVLQGVGVLVVIYLATSYALVPMAKWGLVQLGDQIASLGTLIARALPLLLLIVTALFLNAEVWEVTGTLPGLRYTAMLALLFLIGASFVAARLPGDLAQIARFGTWEEVVALSARTPAAALPPPDAADALDVPLSRRERLNIALVLLVTQGVQISLVGLAVGAFFVAFGVIAIRDGTITGWTGRDAPTVLWDLGGDLKVTTELLTVCGFLAAFTALVFTVYLVTDASYREQFRDDVVADVRTTLAARIRYLAARRQRD